MEIKNLSQLKRAVNEGHSFVILKHHLKPQFTGQWRKPSVIQTNGFYSVVADDPNHEVSNYNGGKGSWFPYGKASDWEFADGVCKSYVTRKSPTGESVRREVWEIAFE